MSTALPSYPGDRLDPAATTGLILCGMGGPDGPESVRPFLQNLFSDPRIVPIPRLIAPLAARLIAARRAPAVSSRYSQIGCGGGSPQLRTTLRQAERLAELASSRGQRWIPAAAMRYWHPFPAEAITELQEFGVEQYVVVPTYPQFSRATSGSTIEFVLDALRSGQGDARVHVLSSWERLPGAVATLVTQAMEGPRRWAEEGVDPCECALLYVAHSLPQRLIDAGDPYLGQTLETVGATQGGLCEALVDHASWLERMPGGAEPLLAFQSRVGPIKWVGPEVRAEVRRLANAGCRRLHVQPVSFTCEHIETLHELDIELQHHAVNLGIEQFSRGSALNLDERWLASMSDHLIRSAFQIHERSHVAE